MVWKLWQGLAQGLCILFTISSFLSNMNIGLDLGN